MFQPENTIKVLLTSNLHIGFGEREPDRMRDSTNTLQEIVEIAKNDTVDLVLIAGDMFNESRPSRWALHSSLDILRSHCWGNAPIIVECLNDWGKPQKDGSIALHAPNFLDPNINVALPVLALNGFSDDPSGLGNLCELDTLDRAGVLDYCGKPTSSETVHIPPLLLRKGDSQLCLYTLSAVREELLERLIKDKNITFARPLENVDSWFSLFAVHQDRGHKVGHAYSEPITQLVEPWMDLVVCGREHEGHTDIQLHKAGFRYVQPGSTIRTGFTPEEVAPKQVLMLEICGKQSRVTPIPLKTVRPLVLDRFVWDERVKPEVKTEEGVASKTFDEELHDLVHRVIKRASIDREVNPKLPWPPVAQIMLDITGEKTVNPIKLGERFSDIVANPKSMFRVVMKRIKMTSAVTNGLTNGDSNGIAVDVNDDDKNPSSLEESVLQDLTSLEKEGEFGVLHSRVMAKAIHLLLEKDDAQAIPNAYDWEKDRLREHILAKEGIDAENPTGDMALYHLEHRSQEEEESFITHHQEKLARPPIKLLVQKGRPSAVNHGIPPRIQMTGTTLAPTAVRGRGRPPGAGRGRPGLTAPAPKKPRTQYESEDSLGDDDIVEIPQVATTSSGTRRSGRVTAARTSIVDDGLDGEEDLSDGSEEFLPHKASRTPPSASKPGYAVRGGRAGRTPAAVVYSTAHDMYTAPPQPQMVRALAPKPALRGRGAAAPMAAPRPTGRTTSVAMAAAQAAVTPPAANGGVVWRIISSSTAQNVSKSGVVPVSAPTAVPRGRPPKPEVRGRGRPRGGRR